MKVAVIGGGPSGLVTLKYLKTASKYFSLTEPIEVRLYEAEADIGGTFRYRVYEDAEMVSSKYLTAFSDFRLPPEAPDFVTPEAYLKYLADYCTKFDLWPHIECSKKVTQIRRHGDGLGHIVTTESGGISTDLRFDAIAVCSGLHVEPSIPRIPGLEKVPMVLHSSEFKSREQLKAHENPTVVVLGIGETGMDIGHLAITTPGVDSVVMCHNDGFFCAPKTVPEPIVFSFWGKGIRRPSKPMDTAVASLFDTAYAHPILQRGMWLGDYYTWVIKALLVAICGTAKGLDQWAGTFSEERMHTDSVFFCKSNRAMPYISAKYRTATLVNRIRAAFLNIPIQDTGGRHIDLAPWPKSVDNDGIMHFHDSGRPESEDMKRIVVKPDVVILATGYTRRFAFLDATYPHPTAGDVRRIYNHDDVSIAYIGFVRPSIGAIPPLAEMQAQLWVLRLIQAADPSCGASRDGDSLPAYEVEYALKPRAGRDLFKERNGVEQEGYAYQLALDIGSAPTFTFVRRQGLKTLWTWAMGSNFNTKFRLVGPWKDPKLALHIMEGELFNVTKRSGGLPFFFLYTLVPFFVFGIMSLVLYTWDWVKGKFSPKRD